MTKFTIKQIAEILGISKQGAQKRAEAEAWPYTEQAQRGGYVRLYTPADLPVAIAKALQAQADKAERQAARDAGERLGQNLAALVSTDVASKTAAKRELGEDLTARLARITPAQQRRLDGRLAIMNGYYSFVSTLPAGYKKRTAIEAFATAYSAGQLLADSPARQDFPKFSDRQLYRWKDAFESQGLAGLLDKQDGTQLKDNGKLDSQPAMREFVLGLLVKFPHIKHSAVSDALKVRFAGQLAPESWTLKRAHADGKLAMPEKTAINRFITRWKQDNQQVYTAITNPDAWKNHYMTAQGSRSEHVVRLNQLWELDSTPGDVMLTDGRHHIIGCIDVYSRRGKLLVAKSSKSTAIGSLLRRNMLDWGVMEGVKHDNGQDYVAQYLTRFYAALEIGVEVCNPFSPWEKPHIERFLGTFSHDLVELLIGYIGHDVAERKAIEARSAFSERLFQKDGVLEVRMSSAELQKFCDDWTDSVYAHNAHDGLEGKTPFQRAAEYTGEIRRIQDVRALDILLAEAPSGDGCRTVQKKGIELDGAWFIAPKLGILTGQRVQVRYDAGDLGRIYVFDETGAFLTQAECPERTGIDRQEVANAARAIQKRVIQEQKKELKAVARRANVDQIAQEIIEHRAREAGKLISLPKPSQTHDTHALQQAAAVVRAKTAAPEGGLDAVTARKLAEQQAKRQAMPSNVTELAETPEIRWRRWQGFHETAAKGGWLNEEERAFYWSYPNTPEFKVKARQQGFDPAALFSEVSAAKKIAQAGNA